jgi:hypothetical protein
LTDAHGRPWIARNKFETAPAFRPQHDGAACVAIRIWTPEGHQIRRRGERSRVKDELHVRQGDVRPALEECHLPGRQVGGDAFAEQIGSRQCRHDAVEPHRPVERARFLAQIGDGRRDVVLQILADARQRDFDADIVRAQLFRIPDPGQHQELRRIDDPAAENHLTLGPRRDGSPVAKIFDAVRSRPVEQQPCRQRADFDGQIFPGERRAQIGIRRAAPASVPHRHLRDRKAFLPGAVIVRGRGISGGQSGGREGVDQWIGKRHVCVASGPSSPR